MITKTKNLKISDKELTELRKEVIKEFPDDFALQEIHLSRKILALEAKKSGSDYLFYIQKVVSELNEVSE